MPVYLYRCRHCGHKFEALRGINAKDGDLACPKCGTVEIKKFCSLFYGSMPRSPGESFDFG
jgi:putative FmdB family regulatory protein